MVLILLNFEAFAHCPASYKEENVCLMLKQNTIFIYSHDADHNGPYKDLEKSELKSVKNDKTNLAFKKLARGIYKLDTKDVQKNLSAFISADKKLTEIKLKQE